MTRDEHLAWCKERALDLCKQGDLPQAFASMMSDLRKHPGTEDHGVMELGAMLMNGGHLGTRIQMEKFIEGFN